MSYLTAVLADNPLHYWRMADPGGHVAHDIGSSPIALVANILRGEIGYSGPNSDGGAALVSSSPFWYLTPIAFTLPLSIEILVWQTMTANRAQKLLSLENSDAVYNGLTIGLDSTSHPQAISNNTADTDAAAISVGHWHHLVVTHTGAQRKLYVDAINTNTSAVVLAGGNGYVSVGARGSDLQSPAEAFVSECAVYAATLTPTQINNHFIALDNTSSKPVYRQSGTFSFSTGISTFFTPLIEDVLNSVRKVY